MSPFPKRAGGTSRLDDDQVASKPKALKPGKSFAERFGELKRELQTQEVAKYGALHNMIAIHKLQTQSLKLEYKWMLQARRLQEQHMHHMLNLQQQCQNALRIVERGGHICSTCHRKFMDQSSLEEHQRSHSAAREKQNARFIQSQALKRESLFLSYTKMRDRIINQEEDSSLHIASRFLPRVTHLHLERAPPPKRATPSSRPSIDEPGGFGGEWDEDDISSLDSETHASYVTKVALFLEPEKTSHVLVTGLSPSASLGLLRDHVAATIQLPNGLIQIVDPTSYEELPLSGIIGPPDDGMRVRGYYQGPTRRKVRQTKSQFIVKLKITQSVYLRV